MSFESDGNLRTQVLNDEDKKQKIRFFKNIVLSIYLSMPGKRGYNTWMGTQLAAGWEHVRRGGRGARVGACEWRGIWEGVRVRRDSPSLPAAPPSQRAPVMRQWGLVWE